MGTGSHGRLPSGVLERRAWTFEDCLLDFLLLPDLDIPGMVYNLIVLPCGALSWYINTFVVVKGFLFVEREIREREREGEERKEECT